MINVKVSLLLSSANISSENFGKMQNFCKNHYWLKRSCGIQCSDSSIFEVLVCHINNFYSFTFINVCRGKFDFTIYLFKFLSVRPQNMRSTVIMSQPITRKNFEFFTLFFVNFSHFLWNFRERTKCENEAKWSLKMRNFLETIFPFRWKP